MVDDNVLVSANHDTPLSLPQPRRPQDERFEYVLYEQVEERFFQSKLEPGTLCWVLKSKGLQSKRDDDTCSQRSELFLRARVVDDGDEFDPLRRVLVRYPKGSTYQVKRSNLVPVLEPPLRNLVLIMAETPDYRRASVVHTCIGDSFLEIGCDYGACVDRVQRTLTEVNSVPQDAAHGPVALPQPDKDRIWCIGIDKSVESVDIAVNRYPDVAFSMEDALSLDGVDKLRALCDRKMQHGHPTVVAVDINGNREIPAVLQCVEHILNPDSETWSLPRLILVKSRLLHIAMRQKPSPSM